MKEKGFTLVELLVVIAILTVLPLIVVSDFPRIRLQFSLSRVAYSFAQSVRNAEDLALSSVTFLDQFGVVQPISGYGVFVDVTNLGNKKYIIYADVYPGNSQYDQLDYILTTVDFSAEEPGIVIKDIINTSNQQASINFTPPNPDITLSELVGNNQSVDIIFSFENDPETTKTVSINSAGLIEVQ